MVSSMGLPYQGQHSFRNHLVTTQHNTAEIAVIQKHHVTIPGDLAEVCLRILGWVQSTLFGVPLLPLQVRRYWASPSRIIVVVLGRLHTRKGFAPRQHELHLPGENNEPEPFISWPPPDAFANGIAKASCEAYLSAE